MKNILRLAILALAACAFAAFAETEKTPQAAKKSAARRQARVTSATTYYDRKEGVAVFTGHVHVDDEEYQLHADKAYLFLTSTNDLKRIVATGHVALTNGTRRAYGTKVSYYRENGLVVLYGDGATPAEVRDEPKAGEAQVVRGEKIRFWVGAEQVEVVNSEITAPVKGADIKRLRENL